MQNLRGSLLDEHRCDLSPECVGLGVLKHDRHGLGLEALGTVEIEHAPRQADRGACCIVALDSSRGSHWNLATSFERTQQRSLGQHTRRGLPRMDVCARLIG